MPIYAQATTETTPSEEKGIQQKDNTSSLLPVLLRAVSQLGVLKRLAGYLRRSSNPASGRHTPGFRTSRRQFLFCNTLARRKGGRHWTFPQTAGGGCTQLPGSVPREQNSMCSATGRHVFPRELHTEPVWTEVSGRVSSTVRLGYTPTQHSSLTLFASI